MRLAHSRDVIRLVVKASNDNLLQARLVTLDFFIHSPNQIRVWSAIIAPTIGNIRVVAGVTRASRTNYGSRIETALFLDILGDAFGSMARGLSAVAELSYIYDASLCRVSLQHSSRYGLGTVVASFENKYCELLCHNSKLILHMPQNRKRFVYYRASAFIHECNVWYWYDISVRLSHLSL